MSGTLGDNALGELRRTAAHSSSEPREGATFREPAPERAFRQVSKSYGTAFQYRR